MNKKKLKNRIIKLEKRLSEYDSILGAEVDKKIKDNKREIEKVYLLNTPDSELDEEGIFKKRVAEHFNQERLKLNKMEYRINNPIVEWK